MSVGGKTRRKPGRSKASREREQLIKQGVVKPDECGAKLRNGSRCKRKHCVGIERCVLHCRKTKEQREAAKAEHIVQKRAERTLQMMGEIAPVTDPIGALEDVAGMGVAFLDIMRCEVMKREDVGYSSDQGLEQIRAEIQVFLQAMGRVESILSNIVRLDLETRRVRVTEVQIQMTIAAFIATISNGDYDIPLAIQARMRQEMADRMRGADQPAIPAKTTTRGRRSA